MDTEIQLCVLNCDLQYLYLVGKSGAGKTQFVDKVLKTSNFEYSMISLHEIKNEDNIEKMILSRNVMNMFYKKTKNTTKVIVIDDIDTLNNIDKKVVSILTCLIKTKKIDATTRIIFMGTNDSDKKVKDLMKLCHTISISNNLFNPLNDVKHYDNMMNINHNICSILNNEYVKDNVYLSDKSSLCMVFHENIVDHIYKPEFNIIDQLNLYNRMLDHISQGDVYDRISFQRQLWKLSDMSYMIKLDKTNNLYVSSNPLSKTKLEPSNVRFTKILTKYSNEFSNLNFVNDICNTHNIKKFELFEMVQEDNHKNILKEIEVKRIEKVMG